MELEPASSSSSASNEPRNPKRIVGRRKFRETRHPVYRGIRERKGGKWVCEVRELGKKSRIWLGTFSTPEMAARAYDVAALALRGSGCALNFSDSAWRLPQAESSSAADIQSAAVAAAEAFRPLKSVPAAAVTKAFHPTSSEKPDKLDSLETPLLRKVSPIFLDEEAIFNMPGLLCDMAEGMLITPPAMAKGFSWDDSGTDCSMDLSLWID